MTTDSKLEKKLLGDLQTDFPLAARPYLQLAKTCGSGEQEVIETISDLLARGKIRRISANFDSKALGYVSALVGAEVAPAHLEAVADYVSRHPGVTHNYERFHTFNLWFTIAVSSEKKIDEFLEKVKNRSGVKSTLKLPVMEYYKLNVLLDPETGQNNAKSSSQNFVFKEGNLTSFSETDKALVRLIQKEIPLEANPFETIGTRIGLTEAEVLTKIKFWKQSGVIRKFGAILNHRKMGARSNAMVVWRVPEEKSAAAGRRMAEFPQISHCYRRATAPNWPYSHYTMIHAPNPGVLQHLIDEVSSATGISEFIVLKSGREFKKTGMRYFEENL